MNIEAMIDSLLRRLYKWCRINGYFARVEKEELIPNPTDRDIITMEEVDSFYGVLPTILLMFDRKLLETKEFPQYDEFVWFTNGFRLSARWKNKFFNWNGKNWEVDNEQDTRNNNQGLGQEQEENSGQAQPHQEASQETAQAGKALRDENKSD